MAADMGSGPGGVEDDELEEEEDDEAEADEGVDESRKRHEDAGEKKPVLWKPTMKRDEGVCHREVLDPCLWCLMYSHGTQTHNQERGERQSRDHGGAAAMG